MSTISIVGNGHQGLECSSLMYAIQKYNSTILLRRNGDLFFRLNEPNFTFPLAETFETNKNKNNENNRWHFIGEARYSCCHLSAVLIRFHFQVKILLIQLLTNNVQQMTMNHDCIQFQFFFLLRYYFYPNNVFSSVRFPLSFFPHILHLFGCLCSFCSQLPIRVS